MIKHDAHVKEYLWRMRLKSRYPYPWSISTVFFFIFCIFFMGFYFGHSYAFYADDLFNCLK
jgi:hypothetical protein